MHNHRKKKHTLESSQFSAPRPIPIDTQQCSAINVVCKSVLYRTVAAQFLDEPINENFVYFCELDAAGVCAMHYGSCVFGFTNNWATLYFSARLGSAGVPYEVRV